MHHFCTYFDQHYLLHGLTLYRSLIRHAGDFTLYILCLDDVTFDFLTRADLRGVRPIALGDFEHDDVPLLEAKKSRRLVEYYFTCTPSLPLYVMDHFPGIDRVTYLDSDLFFYADPAPVYEEMGDHSILIIPHRFSPDWRAVGEKFGIYNVGFLAFRSDALGRECLRWWRERCLEWCHDTPEETRYADQKYLDDWPERFRGVVVLEHKGANLARWNWMNYDIQLSGGRATIDGQPLIFYHFNSFRIINRFLFDPTFGDYYLRHTMPRALRRWLYIAYVKELRESWRWINQRAPGMSLDLSNVRARRQEWRLFLRRLLERDLIIAIGPWVYCV